LDQHLTTPCHPDTGELLPSPPEGNNTAGLSVAVIGGGYAGMAAAVELSRQGIQVTVFESAKQLGGRARGVTYQNTQLDNGQHLLLGCYHETLRLIEQVGGNIEQDFLRLPLQLTLHQQFQFKTPALPAPLHLLAGLLFARGLSWPSRLNAMHFISTLRSAQFHLPHDMTVATMLEQYKQDNDLIWKLWEPLCIAALNTPIDKASAQVLLNVLNDALNQHYADSNMLLPRTDLTTLFPQRAATYIRRHGGKVLGSCGVEKIVPHDNHIELVTTQGHVTFSHAICATQPAVAAKLLRPISALTTVTEQIEALTHQPIYTVYLQYPGHVKLPDAMLGLHQRYSQWLFDKGRISRQRGLIAAVISAEGMHQELSQDELVQKIVTELRNEFNINEPPQWHMLIAEKRATFSCEPDIQRPQQQTALPRLLLAGDYTAGRYPATLEGAVQSGLRCAAYITQV